MDLSCQKTRSHLINLLKYLEPRRYLAEELIQDQFSEVFEVTYIMRGQAAVGYRLLNDTYFGMVLSKGRVLNDFAVIQNKVSEFLYKAVVENVEGLAIRREKFNLLLKD